MRVTSSMYYKNIVGHNNSKLSKELFDVNKQISSGLKIQYAHDDVRTFTETMRLDNELTTLTQASNSIESGYKFSNQTDSVLSEFQTTIDRTKTLLIQASNASQSESSLDAIASELRNIEDHLKNLSNTSINGKYIFSGSAVDTKPIDDNGIYQGNDNIMKAFAGAGIQQKYNISGAELFLGEDTLTQRQVTTNVPQYNLSLKYPNFDDPTNVVEPQVITPDDTIGDLMGDIDTLNTPPSSHFYLSGIKSSGESFTKQITMSPANKVDDLLTEIGLAYGNTSTIDVVNVSMNEFGQIVVEDKLKGSSKLDFHMVGAIDYNATATVDAGDIGDAIYGATAGDIDNLKYGETDFDKIITDTSLAANQHLYVKKFIESPFNASTTHSDIAFRSAEFSMDRSVAAGDTLSITLDDGSGGTTLYTQAFTVDALTTYEALKTQIEAGDSDFTVDILNDVITLDLTAEGIENGAFVTTGLANDNGSGIGAVTVTTTNVGGTIVNDINSIAYDETQFFQDGATLTSNVAQIIAGTNEFAIPSTKLSEVADLSSGTAGTLDGTVLNLRGNTTAGAAYNATINLNSAGSTFSLDGGVTNYTIFNMANPRAAVDADEMTYQQFTDVINMIVTSNIPASVANANDYDAATDLSNTIGETFLSYDGKLTFNDKNSTTTQADIAIFDSNSQDFTTDSSVMTFNTNNALTIRDAKTDFFKTFDEIITSVENHKIYPDSRSGNIRSVGMENSIAMIDDLKDHVGKAHALVGAQSNALTNSLERTQMLEISTMTLRSSVIDTDIAEASLTLSQLQLNYQAMLSTVNKISQLSLVNYL